mgnify:CR=1 FL=1
MFLSDVATAAKQVFILYVLVLLGFICDRTKIYTEKAARLTNDLLFYIVTPAIIIQSFSSVEMSGENVRGMLMSFLGGTILHVVAIVICIPFWHRTDKNLSCIYKYAAIRKCRLYGIAARRGRTRSRGRVLLLGCVDSV